MSREALLLSPKRLTVLFFSIAGVRFGVDANQIESMTYHCEEEPIDILRFDDLLGIESGSSINRSPVSLVLRTKDLPKHRIEIDVLEDLVEIGPKEILSFPSVMTSFVREKGMWGIVLRNGGIVLLIDFLHLLQKQFTIEHRPKTATGDPPVKKPADKRRTP